MKTIEIYFGDLIPEKQKELLDAVGASDPKEMNWDIPTFPVAVVDLEESADENS